MPELYENTTEWQLNETEIAKYLTMKKGAANAGIHKLYIPKLMPLIGYAPGYPYRLIPKKMSVNPSCYSNSPACKPAVSRTLLYQLYIEVPQFSNRAFKKSLFYPGDIIEVEVKDKNPDTIFVSNKIDNSTDE